MALENARKFLEQVMKDKALRARTAEKEPVEVVAIARELGFDVTAEELMQAEQALKNAAGNAETPVELNADDIDKVVGGMAFCGEDAPDGHEMGCFISWYGDQWQEKNGIYCGKMNLCDRQFHVCLSTPNRNGKHDLIMDS